MHTKQNSPVFSCDLNSHTGTVSLLSNAFYLTHTAADFAVSLLPPRVSRPSFTHRSLPPLAQEENKLASPSSEVFDFNCVKAETCFYPAGTSLTLCDLNTSLWQTEHCHKVSLVFLFFYFILFFF